MSQRMEKVNELLQQEIGQFLQRAAGPDFIVTIHQVICSPDLRTAKVYLSGLVNPKKYLSELAQHLRKRVKLKYLPQLTFIKINPSQSDHLEKIFNQL